MENIILIVEGMSCSHCVHAIEGALGEVNGIGSAEVNLEEKTVTVSFDSDLVTVEEIKQIIEDEGYEVV